MNDKLKLHFIKTMLRFQKIDICPCTIGDTHYTEFVILSSIANSCPTACGNLNVSEIKDTLHISQSAVSQSLKSLEKKGYITRNIDINDRRKITISVTDRGHNIINISTKNQQRMMNELFLRFGIEDIELLIELLERLLNAYESLEEIEGSNF